MFKKKNLVMKIATFLIVIAPIAINNARCAAWVGEPQLPKKLLKEDAQI